MISVQNDGKLCVIWVQNGIKNRRYFRSEKEARQYQELLEDLQNTIKLCEEIEKFNKNFMYDPNIVDLKNAELGKEIEELKERIRIKKSLQKRLGEASQKLAEQPRNVIDRTSFFKEMKEIRNDINRLDRFFKEHAIIRLNQQLHEALDQMRLYFHRQKESIKAISNEFNAIKKEVIQNLGSIKTKDRVLTLMEVAEYLHISRSTVEAMMFLEGLPYFKVGIRYRIKEADLTRWIEKHKKKRRDSDENSISGGVTKV